MRRFETIFRAMGTVNSISISSCMEETPDGLLTSLREAMFEADDRLSIFKPESEISRINRASSGMPDGISEGTLDILLIARACKEETGGLFDIDPKKNHILDLGGIAKGYMLDKAVEQIQKSPFSGCDVMLNYGGSIAIMGSAEWIRIRNPFHFNGVADGSSVFLSSSPKNPPAIEVCCKNEKIITSGLYENFSKEAGTIRHHIIDPRTGRSSDTDLVSVTLIGTCGAKMDALATACIVAGIRESLSWLRKHNIEGIYIRKDGSAFATEGLRGRIRFVNSKEENAV